MHSSIVLSPLYLKVPMHFYLVTGGQKKSIADNSCGLPETDLSCLSCLLIDNFVASFELNYFELFMSFFVEFAIGF